MTLGHNVRSKAEVDEVMAQAERAGATITDPAHDRFFGGCSGYFRDPDGHIWEAIWNPGMVAGGVIRRTLCRPRGPVTTCASQSI